ncbi:MAG: hypothetical protein M1504_04180 [Candidatus Marsarchaeota archaeon]|nr:hypothetical protein [Candidatus Marsarchaeota archaeon]
MDYVSAIRGLGATKRFGQNFLINEEIAKTEANFGIDKKVIEMGPGLGVLTRELCKVSEKVLAVELDEKLFYLLSNDLGLEKNLKLKNADFFDVPDAVFNGFDIMIANVPYGLSSKTIDWLSRHRIPALLCLQKEFVEHMLAKPDSDKYSKLSVISALMFKATKVLEVSRGNFYPRPRVDSTVVFLKPTEKRLSGDMTYAISLIMQHKKKKLRNAIMDSKKMLLKRSAIDISRLIESIPTDKLDKRPFQMEPEELLGIARHISSRIKTKTS